MSHDMTACDDTLLEFERLIEEHRNNPWTGALRTGVDLGTANIVLAVVDEENRPVAGVTYPSTVVRDGVVVDYMGAVRTVTRLKAELEQQLGVTLDAAASVLGITDGAVVDVGGGTTGISILKDGEVIYVDDEPTGGTHMTLVLAGFHGCDTKEAELMKRDPAQEHSVFPVIKPVVEKMAAIVKRCLEKYPVDTVYVVGGACCFTEFETVFQKYLEVPVVKPAAPLLVTPLGIAMNCTE